MMKTTLLDDDIKTKRASLTRRQLLYCGLTGVAALGTAGPAFADSSGGQTGGGAAPVTGCSDYDEGPRADPINRGTHCTYTGCTDQDYGSTRDRVNAGRTCAGLTAHPRTTWTGCSDRDMGPGMDPSGYGSCR